MFYRVCRYPLELLLVTPAFYRGVLVGAVSHNGGPPVRRSPEAEGVWQTAAHVILPKWAGP